MRGRNAIGAALLLGIVAARAGDVATAAAAPATRPAAPLAGEPAWSEPLNGLRVRLTSPAGTTCRAGEPLPLVVEVRNDSDRPIARRSLWTTVRFLAHDAGGKWLGVPAMGPEV